MSLKYFNNLQDFNYQTNSIKNKLLVIYFTASWCGPCKRVSPNFLSVSNMNKYQDECIFYKVDVDEHIDISTICNISSIPTFIILYNGDIIHEFSCVEESYLIYNLETCMNHLQQMKNNDNNEYIDDNNEYLDDSSDNEIITNIYDENIDDSNIDDSNIDDSNIDDSNIYDENIDDSNIDDSNIDDSKDNEK